MSNPIALNALLPSIPHRPVSLVRTQDLITGPQGEPELDDLQCLGGAPCEREFFEVAAQQCGSAPPNSLACGLRTFLGPVPELERS